MSQTTVLERFQRSERAVAATEFALLAPLLLLVLGITVELGRMTMSYRQFQAAVIGVSRHIVRYPEYEIRSRNYAPAVAKALFPAGNESKMNLVVDSLVKTNGTLKEVFPPHVLFGTDPKLKWRDYVRDTDYVNDEAVVFVGATYSYTPIFLTTSLSLTFRKNVVLLPTFSRKFPWNDGKVADKYVF